jgi:DNA polymerase
MNACMLKDIAERIASCRDCPLGCQRHLAVPGSGPHDAKIMIVGEAPGANEDLLGRPFAGRAGSVLDQALSEAGLIRSQIFITNVVKCRPQANRRPKRSEIKACSGYLSAQIEAIDPSIICCMGNTAAFALIGSVGVTSMHGRLFGRVLVTYHPAAIVRNRNLMGSLLSDMKALSRLATVDRSDRT